MTDPADLPSADAIARALIAACLIDGGDCPERIASGQAGLPWPAWLAARALKQVYPYVGVRKLLAWVSGGNGGAYTGFGAAATAERWARYQPQMAFIESAIRNPAPLAELRGELAGVCDPAAEVPL
jgi:hypothetical protein